MATYLQLTNNVLDALGWGQLTQSTFGNPSTDNPGSAVKRNLNLAKDQVLSRLGFTVKEKEFSFQTEKVYEGAASSLLTISAGNQNIVFSLGSAPDIDSTFIGWKLRLSPSLNTSANIDDAWYRVQSVNESLNAVVVEKTDWEANVTGASSGWELFKDEYALDASVRQPLNAWRGDSPLFLDFVEEHREHDRDEPGEISFGDPEDIMVYRSPTVGNLWEMQITPMPKNPQFIRYKARTWPADLTAYDDSWDLEPELQGYIERQALQNTVNSPVESDPELAISLGQQNNADIRAWADRNRPRDPSRRRRREGPDESQRRHRLRVADLSSS